MKNFLSFVAIAACAFCVAATARSQDLKVGGTAPSIKVDKWVKGAPVSSFEPDHIYVVEFWATWCGPCKVSIPKLTELAKKYGDKLTVIGVSVSETNTSDVEPFVAKMGNDMDYHVAIDSQESPTARSGVMNKNWMQAAGQGGIPTAFIVGRTGLIEYIGSPFDMEPALAQVEAGTWDRDAFAKKLQSDIDQRKKAAGQQQKEMDAWHKTPLGLEFDKLQALFKAKKYDQFIKEEAVYGEMKGDKMVPDPKKESLYGKRAAYYRMGDMENYYRMGATLLAHEVALPQADFHNDGTAMLLNSLAWAIVDPDSKVQEKNYKFALKAALASIKAGKYSWNLDTLARAYFFTGDKEKAISTEAEALKFEGEGPNKKLFQDTIKKFGGN